MEMNKIKLNIFLIIGILFKFGDIVTTYIALSSSKFYELNPLINYLIENYSLNIGLICSFVLGSMSLVLMRLLLNIIMTKFILGIYFGMIIVHILVVLFNGALLIRGGVIV